MCVSRGSSGGDDLDVGGMWFDSNLFLASPVRPLGSHVYMLTATYFQRIPRNNMY